MAGAKALRQKRARSVGFSGRQGRVLRLPQWLRLYCQVRWEPQEGFGLRWEMLPLGAWVSLGT